MVLKMGCASRTLLEHKTLESNKSEDQLDEGALQRWQALVEAALWHSLCNMRIVSDRSFHAKSVRLSLLPVNDGVRPACYLPLPVQRATSTHPAKHNKLGQL